jgi:hypothetical protein
MIPLPSHLHPQAISGTRYYFMHEKPHPMTNGKGMKRFNIPNQSQEHHESISFITDTLF